MRAPEESCPLRLENAKNIQNPSSLSVSGFKDITIIDLDTIDVSNLNRQFLFQKQHVGKSKSACAKEAALR